MNSAKRRYKEKNEDHRTKQAEFGAMIHAVSDSPALYCIIDERGGNRPLWEGVG
jgi:hypothetical protein